MCVVHLDAQLARPDIVVLRDGNLERVAPHVLPRWVRGPVPDCLGLADLDPVPKHVRHHERVSRAEQMRHDQVLAVGDAHGDRLTGVELRLSPAAVGRGLLRRALVHLRHQVNRRHRLRLHRRAEGGRHPAAAATAARRAAVHCEVPEALMHHLLALAQLLNVLFLVLVVQVDRV